MTVDVSVAVGVDVLVAVAVWTGVLVGVGVMVGVGVIVGVVAITVWAALRTCSLPAPHGALHGVAVPICAAVYSSRCAVFRSNAAASSGASSGLTCSKSAMAPAVCAAARLVP